MNEKRKESVIKVFNLPRVGVAKIIEIQGRGKVIVTSESELDAYDFLACACEFSRSDENFDLMIYMADMLGDNSFTYNNLRTAVCVESIADEIQYKRSYVYGKTKTYLMLDSNTGLVKIGRSCNPKKRETTLQSEKPTIVLFKVCDKNIESKLHQKYASKRVRGEWFRLSKEDIHDIVSEFDFK